MSMDVMGVTLSFNQKTGESLNCDHSTCRPTRLCTWICYGKALHGERLIEARRCLVQLAPDTGIKANSGPITWPKQQAMYRRNTEQLKKLAAEGKISLFGEALASHYLNRRGRKATQPFVLRACGLGDLFDPLTHALAHAAAAGLPIYLYSRKPEQIRLLATLCDVLAIPAIRRPMVLGSIDPTTKPEDIRELILATRAMNGKATLAATAMTAKPRIPYEDNLWVVFGYHTSRHKTKVEHPLACPATNGEAIKCYKCRRCYGHFA